jgi:hypothetical protein
MDLFEKIVTIVILTLFICFVVYFYFYLYSLFDFLKLIRSECYVDFSFFDPDYSFFELL